MLSYPTNNHKAAAISLGALSPQLIAAEDCQIDWSSSSPHPLPIPVSLIGMSPQWTLPTKGYNPAEDCGKRVGGRFRGRWGECREGGLEPQLITGEFNGIFHAGATPSNYLRTKGRGPQVWRTGLGGLGRRCAGEGELLQALRFPQEFETFFIKLRPTPPPTGSG